MTEGTTGYGPTKQWREERPTRIRTSLVEDERSEDETSEVPSTDEGGTTEEGDVRRLRTVRNEQ